MVTGWMLSTGTDTKGRRLLYIKKKHAYYLLPQHREFAITLWKHAEINAISISIILGYFLFHSIAGTALLALALYVLMLLVMNKKLLPSLHRVQGKNITWRKEKPGGTAFDDRGRTVSLSGAGTDAEYDGNCYSGTRRLHCPVYRSAAAV